MTRKAAMARLEKSTKAMLVAKDKYYAANKMLVALQGIARFHSGMYNETGIAACKKIVHTVASIVSGLRKKYLKTIEANDKAYDEFSRLDNER